MNAKSLLYSIFLIAVGSVVLLTDHTLAAPSHDLELASDGTGMDSPVRALMAGRQRAGGSVTQIEDELIGLLQRRRASKLLRYKSRDEMNYAEKLVDSMLNIMKYWLINRGIQALKGDKEE